MSSPTKDDLKTIADELKSEITSEHHLKHAETKEKNSLPSKEAIETEKAQQELLQGIANFDAKAQLKPTETQEKVVLPTKDVIEEEKQAAKE
ncbi:thymosin beta [Tetranychus urticae]|uniref:Thymosin beta n=1 Tax=Tetranychus urticae TaxID=32264 RepID=T1K2F7_TETUR|nr:thymosin beta [Tetranychus urticae]